VCSHEAYPGCAVGYHGDEAFDAKDGLGTEVLASSHFLVNSTFKCPLNEVSGEILLGYY
jgi:hypothetical protein